MKIVALVPNSGARDGRVMKEAQSLAEAGHEVHVIGIRERDHASVAAVIDDNVTVHRVSWQSRAYSMALVRLVAVGCVFALVGLALLAGLVAVSGASIAQLSLNSIEMVGNVVEMAGAWWTEQIAGLTQGWTLQRGLSLLSGLLLGVLAIGVLLVALRLLLLVFRVVVRAVRSLMEPIRRFANFTANYAEVERTTQHARDEFLTAFGSGKLVQYYVGGALERFISRTVFKTTQRARAAAMVELGLKLEPELVYCHEVMSLPAAVELKRHFGVKLIYDAHEMYDGLNQASADISSYYKGLHRKLLPEVDQMVVVSDAMRDVYIQEYPDIPPVMVLPNSTLVADLPEYDGRLHDAAGLPRDRKILLYQGGFSPNRGIENVVRAAANLEDGWSLVLMGWGKLEGFIESEQAQLAKEWVEKTKDAVVAEVRQEQRLARREEIAQILASFSPVGNLHHFQKRIDELLGVDRGEAGSDDGSPDGDELDAPHNSSTAPSINVTVNAANGREAEAVEARTDEGAGELALVDRVRDYLDSTVTVVEQWEPMAKRLKEALDAQIRTRQDMSLCAIHEEDFDKIRVVPAAPREQLHLWTQGAAVGIIPYPNDGLNHWVCAPNKLWEYPNAGVPILGSPVLEIYKTVTRNDIGWILPTDPSPRQISDMVNALSDAELAEKSAACRTFLQKSNWNLHIQPWLQLIG